MAPTTTEAMKRMHFATSHRFKQAFHDKYGPGDSEARMLVVLGDGRKFEGVPGDLTGEAAEATGMGTIIGLSIAALMILERSRIEQLILSIETYMRKIRPGEEEVARKTERGDLRREFIEDPDTNVTEGLTTYWCRYDEAGEFIMWMAMEPYHYDDGGALVWGDVEIYEPGYQQGDLYQKFERLFADFGRRKQQ